MVNDVSTEVKSLNDKVKEKIKAAFVDLIPEDQWNSLVDATSKEFMNVELPKIVREELDKKLREEVVGLLQGKDWLEKWNGSEYVASDMLGKIIRDSAPQMVEALFSKIVADAVNIVRNNLARGY